MEDTMRRVSRDRIVSLLLIAPSVIAIAVFVYGFIGFTTFSSFTRWDSLSPDFTLVGLRNYARLFTNDRFLCDLRNTVTFTVLFLAACITIGFVLAVLLDQRIKGEGIFRSIFLLPMAISFIVTGVVWRWLLSPGTAQTGSAGVNLLLEKAGLGFLRWGWFTDPTILHISPQSSAGMFLTRVGLGGFTSPYAGVSLAMISVVIAATWQYSGYTMAMFLAALRGIPDELREAARVDGATEFQMYRHIIIPLLSPITLSAVIVLGHVSLKIFDLVVSMTGAGPGFATDVPALFMWVTTFSGNNFAEGAAVATILLVVVAALIVPYLVSTIRTEAEV
jgi:glucose/mannose transport system permease protein